MTVIILKQDPYCPVVAAISEVSSHRDIMAKMDSLASRCVHIHMFIGMTNPASWYTHHQSLVRLVKLRVAHAPGMPKAFSPPPRISDPDMHHSTCMTHVPWCLPGSLTNGFLWSRWRENVPDIPGACATRNFTYLVRGRLCDSVAQVARQDEQGLIWTWNRFVTYKD